MIKRENMWNIVLTSLVTAAFAVLGWLALSVIQLQNQYAAETAEKELRNDVTDVMNDVDKRLAVIEAVMIFRGGGSAAVKEEIPIPIPPMMQMPQPIPFDPFDESADEESALEAAPEPQMQEPQMQQQQQQQRNFEAPRYNLRKRND